MRKRRSRILNLSTRTALLRSTTSARLNRNCLKTPLQCRRMTVAQSLLTQRLRKRRRLKFKAPPVVVTERGHLLLRQLPRPRS